MPELPDTPAQAAVRKAFDEASREVAMFGVKLKELQSQYESAVARYITAYSAALHAGVIP